MNYGHGACMRYDQCAKCIGRGLVAGLTIRVAGGALTTRLSQVAFRVDVLQHALSSF